MVDIEQQFERMCILEKRYVPRSFLYYKNVSSQKWPHYFIPFLFSINSAQVCWALFFVSSLPIFFGHVAAIASSWPIKRDK